MKKFSFRLEPVLKYKSDLLEVLKNEYAQAAQNVVAQRMKIEELKKEENALILKFNTKKEEGITIAEATIFESFIIKQNKLIKEQTAQLNHLKKIEDEKREKMIGAKKEMLSIEKLKSISEEEYKKETQKENELFIEEFVTGASLKHKKVI